MLHFDPIKNVGDILYINMLSHLKSDIKIEIRIINPWRYNIEAFCDTDKGDII